MRKRPQPHTLSFGFLYKSSLRTFEFGAGVGISKTIYSTNGVNLLNDERCSRLAASRLVTQSRAPIRRKDLEDLATAFRDLVACFGDLEVKVHLIVKKTFNIKALFPDGLTLHHNLPIDKVDNAIATHAIPHAQMIEPDYDWLRLAQTTECPHWIAMGIGASGDVLGSVLPRNSAQSAVERTQSFIRCVTTRFVIQMQRSKLPRVV